MMKRRHFVELCMLCLISLVVQGQHEVDEGEQRTRFIVHSVLKDHEELEPRETEEEKKKKVMLEDKEVSLDDVFDKVNNDAVRYDTSVARHPLFVVMLGGLRWDMLEKESGLKSFDYLKSHGAFVPLVRPTFPPEDLPVWTSIATGLYPEDHGVVGDLMYDLRRRRLFDRSDLNASKDSLWWRHAPTFFDDAVKLGRRVALFHWLHCDIHNTNTNTTKTNKKRKDKKEEVDEAGDCVVYEEGGARRKQAIASLWNRAFGRLKFHNYDLSLVYTDVLRRTSEVHGLQSDQTRRALHDLDDLLRARLIDVRTQAELGKPVNLLVLSDYGQSDAKDLKAIRLEQHIEMKRVQFVILSAGYVAIIPYALEHQAILESLQSLGEGCSIYMSHHPWESGSEPAPTLLPAHLRYSGREWTNDIVLLANPGFSFELDSNNSKVLRTRTSKSALHSRSGINPYFEEPKYPKFEKGDPITPQIQEAIDKWQLYHRLKHDMFTPALALGPDFRKGVVASDTLDSVDFYQLFCLLLQIPARAHSGQWHRVSNLLIPTHNRASKNGHVSLKIGTLVIVNFVLKSTITHFSAPNPSH